MKEVWERIKAAGKALFTPDKKEELQLQLLRQLPPDIQREYVVILRSDHMRKGSELTPWEEVFEAIFAIISKLIAAGKALFTPREKGNAAAVPAALTTR